MAKIHAHITLNSFTKKFDLLLITPKGRRRVVESTTSDVMEAIAGLADLLTNYFSDGDCLNTLLFAPVDFLQLRRVEEQYGLTVISSKLA